eukprot:CAMPEP_0197055900 /NCGR_PEP_ID=MMETSP1384-20130603/75204_1 /TAXON_ID=29189 /ORGANISM="Ammonia sp." /LENGTH=70 /DNA_ID=CAMNT_0042489653 /DNA_START=8 /DNA_END=216 /DNA_ORIENTATION=+
MDEDLRFYEPPKITLAQRVKVGGVSFVTGFGAAVLTAGIVAVIQKQPINRALWKQARYTGLSLGTIFAVG